MPLLDRLAQGNALAQRSPSEKAAASVSALLLALILPPWPWALAVFLLMAAATLLLARISLGDYLRVLLLPLGFLAAGALALALSLSADFPWLGLAADGGEEALRVTLRALAGVSGLLFLALSTPLADLARLLERLGAPQAVAELMLLIYRMVLLLLDTAFSMQAAQAARLGYAGPWRSLASVGQIAAGLLPRALARARGMEIGLAARLYEGRLAVLAPPRPASLPVLAAILLADLVLLAGALA
jgi:cobalt/nickel transport system permease protein